MVVELHRSIRLKTRKDKGIHELFKGDTMLQPERDCDGKTIHEAAERGALFMHVQENFPDGAVFVFACS